MVAGQTIDSILIVNYPSVIDADSIGYLMCHQSVINANSGLTWTKGVETNPLMAEAVG